MRQIDVATIQQEAQWHWERELLVVMGLTALAVPLCLFALEEDQKLWANTVVVSTLALNHAACSPDPIEIIGGQMAFFHSLMTAAMISQRIEGPILWYWLVVLACFCANFKLYQCDVPQVLKDNAAFWRGLTTDSFGESARTVFVASLTSFPALAMSVVLTAGMKTGWQKWMKDKPALEHPSFLIPVLTLAFFCNYSFAKRGMIAGWKQVYDWGTTARAHLQARLASSASDLQRPLLEDVERLDHPEAVAADAAQSQDCYVARMTLQLLMAGAFLGGAYLGQKALVDGLMPSVATFLPISVNVMKDLTPYIEHMAKVGRVMLVFFKMLKVEEKVLTSLGSAKEGEQGWLIGMNNFYQSARISQALPHQSWQGWKGLDGTQRLRLCQEAYQETSDLVKSWYGFVAALQVIDRMSSLPIVILNGIGNGYLAIGSGPLAAILNGLTSISIMSVATFELERKNALPAIGDIHQVESAVEDDGENLPTLPQLNSVPSISSLFDSSESPGSEPFSLIGGQLDEREIPDVSTEEVLVTVSVNV